MNIMQGNTPPKRKRERSHEALVTTCVRIPANIWEKCHELRIPFGQVFMRGWMVMNGEPQILSRQKELEQENERRMRAMDVMQERIRTLSKEIEEMRK